MNKHKITPPRDFLTEYLLCSNQLELFLEVIEQEYKERQDFLKERIKELFK